MELYRGKSKIISAGRDADTLLMRFTDAITAFNGEKSAELPGKGELNAAISGVIYGYLAENGIETHILDTVSPCEVLVKKSDIIGVEIIVRNAAAGSFSKKYGVAEGKFFDSAAVEFSVKSDALGDPMINISQIIALGLATREELDEMMRQTLRINGLLCGLFAKAKIKLIDFKLEFGRYGNDGRLILCDEISPDSCRLWDADTGEKLDKDLFRLGAGDVLNGYREVLRRLQNVRGLM